MRYLTLYLCSPNILEFFFLRILGEKKSILCKIFVQLLLLLEFFTVFRCWLYRSFFNGIFHSKGFWEHIFLSLSVFKVMCCCSALFPPPTSAMLNKSQLILIHTASRLWKQDIFETKHLWDLWIQWGKTKHVRIVLKTRAQLSFPVSCVQICLGLEWWKNCGEPEICWWISSSAPANHELFLMENLAKGQHFEFFFIDQREPFLNLLKRTKEFLQNSCKT